MRSEPKMLLQLPSADRLQVTLLHFTADCNSVHRRMNSGQHNCLDMHSVVLLTCVLLRALLTGLLRRAEQAGGKALPGQLTRARRQINIANATLRLSAARHCYYSFCMCCNRAPLLLQQCRIHSPLCPCRQPWTLLLLGQIVRAFVGPIMVIGSHHEAGTVPRQELKDLGRCAKLSVSVEAPQTCH
jgi:hypothetical protein